MKNDEVPFNTNQNYLNLLSIILWKSWGVVSDNSFNIILPSGRSLNGVMLFQIEHKKTHQCKERDLIITSEFKC